MLFIPVESNQQSLVPLKVFCTTLEKGSILFKLVSIDVLTMGKINFPQIEKSTKTRRRSKNDKISIFHFFLPFIFHDFLNGFLEEVERNIPQKILCFNKNKNQF